jgi:hypothetical protein
MSTYFGGRSEVHLRRSTERVIYCDFLSMYPTVCTLMGLWGYIIAQGVDSRESTVDTRAFLDKVDLLALQRPETWRVLPTIVRVRPDGDILPVRAKYGTPPVYSYTIGLNFLTSKEPLWFTLADCISAKLLTGKVPEVIEAIEFKRGLRQLDLMPIRIAGEPDYLIDPSKDDFFRRVIEFRIETKKKMKSAKGTTLRTLDAYQEFLKILANSTAYGISVQLDPEELNKRVHIHVYGPRNRLHKLLTAKYEKPGPYFHPLLGTATTASARLMLAIAERLILDAGLDWAFCDTDSMAIAKPNTISEAEFRTRVEKIRDWFTPLNPYRGGGPVLKIEDVNYRLKRGKPTSEVLPLYCYAISAKRYALFNFDSQKRPILRKASAHGLGHLRPPNDIQYVPEE